MRSLVSTSLCATSLLAVACGGSEPPPSSDVGTPDNGVADVGVDGFDVESPDIDIESDTPAPEDTSEVSPSILAPEIRGFSPASPFLTRGAVAVEVLLEGGLPNSVTFDTPMGVFLDEREPFGWVEYELPEGTHEIGVRAANASGVADAEFVVVVDNTPPDARLVEPGTSTFGPIDGVLSVEVSLSDATETVVELRLEDALVETLTAPFVYGLDTSSLEGGEATLQVRAVDSVALTTEFEFTFALCEEGTFSCGGVCLPDELAIDSMTNCGGCNLSCEPAGERCELGSCACLSGRTGCADGCRDLNYDGSNCGSCGSSCGSGERCVAGACVESEDDAFVEILPTTFEAGVDQSSLFWAPQDIEREIEITRSFQIQPTEVTQAMWLERFPVNPSVAWDCGYDCPVENVSWWDAVAYANALSAANDLPACYELLECNGLEPGNGLNCLDFGILSESGNPLDCVGYRLPTEAEWEWAARAGSVGDTHAGSASVTDCDELSHQMEIAWFDCNAGSGPRPVASKRPNAFGLYDTAGNVMEWTGDYWASEWDETEFVDPIGPEFGDERAIKGGAWNERAPRLRTGGRLSGLPRLITPFIGFRLARSVIE